MELADFDLAVCGWAELVLENPVEIIAEAAFVGPRGINASPLPWLDEGENEVLFLQVASDQSFGLITGIDLLNFSPWKTSLTVQAFSAGGVLRASRRIELDGKSRVSSPLDGEDFFGKEFSQIGGHIRVANGLPLIAYQFFTDPRGRFLATTHGQRIATWAASVRLKAHDHLSG
jgi:hypothetical protein